jgi:hypothetical protein
MRWLVASLFLWAQALLGALCLLSGEPKLRAVTGMALGVLWIWVALIGGALHWTRDRWIRWGCAAKIGAPSLFFVATTLLACVEEAVACAMTTSAPLWGMRVGEAYITASANCLDLVVLHSVVAFVPSIAAWALWMRRVRFDPRAVSAVFGVQGLLGESIAYGTQSLSNAGFWVLVYATMAWLPAQMACAKSPVARRARWWHYPAAVLTGWAATVPVTIALHASHPGLHFAPL